MANEFSSYTFTFTISSQKKPVKHYLSNNVTYEALTIQPMGILLEKNAQFPIL